MTSSLSMSLPCRTVAPVRLHAPATMSRSTSRDRGPKRLDLPESYVTFPERAQPVLHYLPNAKSNAPLRTLMKAADEDLRLHRARVQAGLHKDLRLLRNYAAESDPVYVERNQRRAERQTLLGTIQDDEEQDAVEKADFTGLTAAERTQLHLVHWNRQMEGYILKGSRNWQAVLESLLDTDDADLNVVLEQARQLVAASTLQQQQAVDDATAHVHDCVAAYKIRLQAHLQYGDQCRSKALQMEQDFTQAGKAALQIGQQLEHAEWKRAQCESASTLIRRWWTMEALADQTVDVEQEVAGQTEGECKLDILYTHPEHSLEAAQALQQLRAVVRSIGNTSNAMTMQRRRKLQATATLITRTSDALEARLLNAFTTVYSAGNSLYDFGNKPRPGAMDWRELRSLASALLLFDSGRSLHKRYVDMVVGSRFPELFRVADGDDVMEDDDNMDMDTTRTTLTNLFRRVGDVCTSEFELVAHVFGGSNDSDMPLIVARALLQRVISDPTRGLQARINSLLAAIDRKGDFDAGSKKLDTFVVVHEKAAGLFRMLDEAAESMVSHASNARKVVLGNDAAEAQSAVDSLKGFLKSQELALSNTHRQAYVNLELRLLHHNCCNSLDQAGCALLKKAANRPDASLAEKGILEEYKAPVLPLHKESLIKAGFGGILQTALKQSVLRQPLVHATDALSRAKLMFGAHKRGGETTSRVILSIYTHMSSFYGQGYLFPLLEAAGDMMPSAPPTQLPTLPFDEELEAPDLGIPPAFWVGLERIHSAAKAFDRELWAEGRENSDRVWAALEACSDMVALKTARDERVSFYTELETKGEAAILKALVTIGAHIQWVLVMGGESMLATGGKSMLSALSGQSGGPYAIPSGSSLETPNSPAVKSLTYCLRVQFVHVQSALSTESLASFWTALSMRMYDILVARLLEHYQVSTVGAVILSRDVESLRSVAMLAGTNHMHWDVLRELLTLYMTPPDAIKIMLTGPDGEPSKGLFHKVGRDRSLVFLSRRQDYRYKTTGGLKKSGWAADMLNEIGVSDPTDGSINIDQFAASLMAQ